MADGLAKRAAARFALPANTAELIQSGEEAVRYAACVLARATHNANNCRTVEVDAEGNSKVTIRRDATQAPRTYKKRLASDCKEVSPPQVKVPMTVKPWVPPSALSATRLASKRKREDSASRVNARVQEIGATLTAVSEGPSAADRLEALRARVSARQAAS